MRRPVWLGSLVATAALLLPVPARADAAVTITQSRYEPARASVAPGGTVTWTNDDGVGHQVTPDDGSFDSSPYHRVHGGPGGRGMAGTITVG